MSKHSSLSSLQKTSPSSVQNSHSSVQKNQLMTINMIQDQNKILLNELNFLKWQISRNNRWKSLSISSIVSTDFTYSQPFEIIEAFLQVVLANDVNGPITLISLQSLDKFISLDLIQDYQSVISAVIQCKFEASDTHLDECVLLGIMKILEHSINKCQVKGLLKNIDDELVCGIMETCFSILFQQRLSEVVKKAAENCVIEVYVILCQYLKQSSSSSILNGSVNDDNIGNISDIIKTHVNDQVKDDYVHIGTQLDNHFSVQNENVQTQQSEDDASSTQNITMNRTSIPDLPSYVSSKFNQESQIKESNLTDRVANQTFTKHSIHEIFKFIINMVSKDYKSTNDISKISAFNLITRIIMESEELILKDEYLQIIIKTDLFKALHLNIRTCLVNVNISLLSVTLRLYAVLFKFEFTKMHKYFAINLLQSYLQDTIPIKIISQETEIIEKLLLKYNCDWIKMESDHNSFSYAEIFKDIENSFQFNYKMFAYNPNTTDPRDMVLDTLLLLIDNEGFCTDLFQNCDCELSNTDLFQNFIMTLLQLIVLPYFIQEIQINSFESYLRLTKNDRERYEKSGDVILASKFKSSQSKAMDILKLILNQFINGVTNYVDDLRQDSEKQKNFMKKILVEKDMKQKYLEASQIFNKSTQLGLEYMMKIGILQDLLPKSVAQICHALPLNKKVLGDFLSKPKNFDILKEFMNLFDWSHQPRIDEALRMVLQQFRLPGEAQQIQRVVEAFSSGYFNICVQDDAEFWKKQNITGTENIKEQVKNKEAPPLNEDAAFVLAYAIIMLNTDQHNPQVRKRMTSEDFIKNLRGTNWEGSYFQKTYLEQIYESIKKDEIIMPDEHEGDLGFEFQVKNICDKSLDKSYNFKDPIPFGDRVCVEKFLFRSIWQVLATSVMYSYHSSDSQQHLHQSIAAFHQICLLSYSYGMYKELDCFLICMFKSSNLVFSASLKTLYNGEVQYKFDNNDDKSIQRVKFYNWLQNDIHSQVALLIAFRNLIEFRDHVNNSWFFSFDIIASLLHYRLLPSFFTDLVEFDNLQINKQSLVLICQYLHKAQSQIQVEDQNSSFFNTLTSFLLPANSQDENEEDLTTEQLQAQKVCLDIVEECKVIQLFDGQCDILPTNAFIALANMCMIVLGKGDVFNISLKRLERLLLFIELFTKMTVNSIPLIKNENLIQMVKLFKAIFDNFQNTYILPQVFSCNCRILIELAKIQNRDAFQILFEDVSSIIRELYSKSETGYLLDTRYKLLNSYRYLLDSLSASEFLKQFESDLIKTTSILSEKNSTEYEAVTGGQSKQSLALSSNCSRIRWEIVQVTLKVLGKEIFKSNEKEEKK